MSRTASTFGDVLRQLRTAASLSQEELAERAGVSPRGISDLERGARRTPHLTTVRLLADALALTPTDRQALLAAARPAQRPDVSEAAFSKADAVSGAKPAAPGLATSTVTLLSAEIAEERRLWLDYGAALPAVASRYEALIHSAVAAHGGTVLTARGTALQVSFPTVSAAVAAALEAQRLVRSEHWEAMELPEPLSVHMAVHAGTLAADARGDVRSPALTYLNRLLASGHPGQVLLSAGVASMLRDLLDAAQESQPESMRLPPGIALRDLGSHRYPDHGLEHVFQLLAPGIPDDFPPLSVSALRAGQLPVAPNPLVGRTAEMLQIRELLLRPEVRLLTLTGPGGVGKTRLAFAVAERLEAVFADGIYLVDLAPLTEPRLVATRIVQALDLNATASQPVTELLLRHLQERHLLLVLDSFEHLLGAAGLPAELLRRCPQLRLLITSRSPLRLRGEQVFPVRPLALPAANQGKTPDDVLQSDAVQLFVERARAVRPGFALDDANAAAVAAICRRVDGLPLAIELAAARIRILTPNALLARSERPLPLLTDGARDAPQRQQTLRDTIAWSVALLGPEEQRLLPRLSVFAGGFTLAAAEAVSETAAAALDVEAGIETLVDTSLVQVTEQLQEPRFAMLETIREFAGEQLAASSERDAVLRGHSAYFLAQAERAKEGLAGPDQAIWLARLDAEQDNMRAVFERAIAKGDAETALRLGAALWRFWGQRGYLGEGRAALERALAIDSHVDLAVRAAAIYYLGNLALDQTEFTTASSHYQESLALWRRLGDQDGIASSLNGLGLVAWSTGDFASAARHFRESLAIWSAIDDQPGVAIAHHNLGRLAAKEGRYELARTHHAQALALRRELGNADGIAYSLWSLATVSLYAGDAAAAESLSRESIAIFQDLGDRQGEAYVLHALARVSQHTGEHCEALRLFHEVLALREALGERNGIIECLEEIAAIVVQRGQAERAIRLLGAAASLRERISLAPWMAEELAREHALASARRLLTKPAFDAAWTAGQRLMREQAIAEALHCSAQLAVAP